MRRDNFFWGGVLILVGVLLYLQAQGIVTNIFKYFWPLALILVGGWIILGVYWRPAPSAEDTFSIPLNAAQSVHYHFSHGAGQLEIFGGAPAGQAIVGTAGVKHVAVGKRIVLARGAYRITMVGQEPDDNTLRLTVR